MSNINTILSGIIDKTTLINTSTKKITNNFSLDVLLQNVKQLDKIITSPDDPTAAMNIHNLDELKEFATNVQNGNTYAKQKINLCNDIDCSSWTDFKGIGSNNQTKCFRGIFNGNNKTIRNIKLDVPKDNNFNGFFNAVWFQDDNGTPAEINDLNFDNIMIYDSIQYGNSHIGGIVGSASTTVNITNCHITNGFIEGWQHVGGLVGHGYAKIQNSSFQGIVKGVKTYACYWGIGGIIGTATATGNTGVINCVFDGEIKPTITSKPQLLSSLLAGGIVGMATGEKPDKSEIYYHLPEQLIVKNNKSNCKMTIIYPKTETTQQITTNPIIGGMRIQYDDINIYGTSGVNIDNSNYWSQESRLENKYKLYNQLNGSGGNPGINIEVLSGGNPVQFTNNLL